MRAWNLAVGGAVLAFYHSREAALSLQGETTTGPLLAAGLGAGSESTDGGGSLKGVALTRETEVIDAASDGRYHESGEFEFTVSSVSSSCYWLTR